MVMQFYNMYFTASLNVQSEDEESMNQLGCSAEQDVFGYPEKPTWRDVLFN